MPMAGVQPSALRRLAEEPPVGMLRRIHRAELATQAVNAASSRPRGLSRSATEKLGVSPDSLLHVEGIAGCSG